MTTSEAIRESASEAEILGLLTAYVQEQRAADATSSLPQPITRLPVNGIVDVGERVATLLAEMDVASRRWDHGSCGAIKQALQVFASALERLQTLRRSRLPLTAEIGSSPPV
jgi:hypothetical protein